MSEYLKVARIGKNDWWRYLISFPGILFIWFFLGSIPVVALMLYVLTDGDPSTSFSSAGFSGIPVLLEFSANMLTFVPFVAATLLAVRFIHARSLGTLITAAAHIRWKKIFTGAIVWFGIAALISIVESLLYPGRYVLTFEPVTWAVFALIALIFIPFQTSAEELFFRGYLLQWMGLRLKNQWVLAFLNGVLFLLPHVVNPEMAANAVLMGLGYLVFGFFLAFITLQDNGIELALGMHAANNLFAALVANYTITAIRSPSMFTVQTLDPAYGLVSLVFGLILFYVIFFVKWPTQIAPETIPE